MHELVETVDVAAPPEQVFAALVDWTTQGEWMLLTDVTTVDGEAQEVGAGSRRAPGCRCRAVAGWACWTG
ncbi:SRPBCC family protein [Klenkia terrae]|uniref:SRPBCC family protein n=1 Tax=Klenkia terrae TaxID=1052259 RepID=UPI00361F8261